MNLSTDGRRGPLQPRPLHDRRTLPDVLRRDPLERHPAVVLGPASKPSRGSAARWWTFPAKRSPGGLPSMAFEVTYGVLEAECDALFEEMARRADDT
jgi:hypothetical protein